MEHKKPSDISHQCPVCGCETWSPSDHLVEPHHFRDKEYVWHQVVCSGCLGELKTHEHIPVSIFINEDRLELRCSVGDRWVPVQKQEPFGYIIRETKEGKKKFCVMLAIVGTDIVGLVYEEHPL
jgi:hypothetical protein